MAHPMFSVLSLAAGGLACGHPYGHDEHEVVARDSIKIAPGPTSTVDAAPINATLGYFVGDLGGGAYWVTEGVYTNMFLVSTHGVIVVDCPTSNVESFAARRRQWGTSCYMRLETRPPPRHPPRVLALPCGPHRRRVALQRLAPDHHRTRRPQPARVAVPARPTAPAAARHVRDNYTRVGNQTLELSYHGPNHAGQPLHVRAGTARRAAHRRRLPGWVPFAELAISDFIPVWTAAHDVLLTFDFDVSWLATLADLVPSMMSYCRRNDLHDSCASAINGGFDVTAAIGPTVAANPKNVWAEFKAYFRVAAQTCVCVENAYRMVNALRVEYDVLGRSRVIGMGINPFSS
ncbi:hypothetical protein B0H14DRAFT_3157729 [Mycena olivaceomarginata]|nr:hypothetical protein B0H14DRAFT_3157729 [Mycena olivaceomarginata]